MNGSAQTIEPRPVPTLWGIDHTADGRFVVLIKTTHGGTSVDFVQAENATLLWQQIRAHTKECNRLQTDGRLLVADQVLLGSNGEVLKLMDHTAHPAEAAMQATADAAAEDAAVREVMGESE